MADDLLGRQVLELETDQSKYDQGLARARGKAQDAGRDIGKSFTAAGKAIGDVGSSMTRNLTLPIVAAGGATAKLALDFETSLNQIVGLTDVTRGEIGGIREEILAMSGDIGKGPQELAEAFYFVASAGFEADEAMEVLRASGQAAAAGLGETQAVAQTVGGVLNAYGKDTISAADATGVLVEAISQGTAEAPAFANVIGRVVPAAAAMGVSFDQVTAALAGMTLTGLSAEEAAVGLNQVFVSLLKPTTQAEDAMRGMGLSSEALRKQLREEGLLATLRTLEERFAGNETAAAAVFGNVRALRSVTSLLTLDTDQLNSIFEKTASSGAARLTKAYEETEGSQRDINRSMADLQATAIELGEDVLPLVVDVLQEIAGGAKELGKWWRSLDDETKDMIVRMAAFVAVAGPSLIVIGKLASGLGALFTAIRFVGGAKGIPLLAKHLGSLRLAALGPAGAIAALGVALWQVSPDKAITDRFTRIADVLKDAGLATEDFQASLSDSEMTLNDFSAEFVRLTDNGMSARDALDALAVGIEEFDAATEAQNAALDASGAKWQAYQEQISGAAETGARDAKAALESLPPEIQAQLAAAGIVIDAEAPEAFDAIPEEAAKAREAAITHMKSMLTGMSSLFETDESVRDAWQGLIDRMDDPYTEAERKADIFSKTTIANIRAAIQSGDPDVTADTALLVNNMLAQIALMEPGALERGEAVPPALRAGMDSQIDALISWIETNVTGQSLSALTLDEATELGLDGIWRYKEGMRRNAAVAVTEARNIAARARQALGIDAYSGGVSLVSSWINGMTGAWGAQQWRVKGITGHAARIFGQSLPTEGPLKGGVAPGGFSVGESWIEGVVDALDRGLRVIGPSLSTVADALAFTPVMPRLAMPGVSTPMTGAVRAAGAGTASSITNQWILNVEGVPRVIGTKQQAVEELERIGESWG